MSLTLRQRRALRRPLDLSRFQPLTPAARDRVDDLMRRGATLVRVTPEQVVVRRQAQLATVDQVGRVQWAA